MKIVRAVGMLAVCGLVMGGSAMAAAEVKAPSPQEIAAKPELVVAAIRDRNVEASAAIVMQSLTAVFTSDWTEAKKRQQVIALISYAVASKGKDAAAMMGLVAARVPAAWLPLVAATAVVAAGDNSPAVAKAMLEAVAADAQAAAACRAACANPSTVLSSAEMRIVRGITLPTPSALPAKASPLPTVIRAAEKYPGQ